MPTCQKAPKKTALGRALVKQKNRQCGHLPTRSQIHSQKEADKPNYGVLDSITQQNNLVEAMLKVEEREREFEIRNHNFKLITPLQSAGVLDDDERDTISRAQKRHSSELRIPRRPHWDADTTVEELHEAERAAFDLWRKDLKELTAVNGLTITPYEKNGQVWQQLWRVVERSDVIVQIVDARNPLMFRCTDLETYVKEVNKDKVNLLLVNKSDHLTEEQRQLWAGYFNTEGVYAVFFSALDAINSMGGLPTVAESDEDEDKEDNSDDENNSDENDRDLLYNNLSNLNITEIVTPHDKITSTNNIMYSPTSCNTKRAELSNIKEEDNDNSDSYESVSSSPIPPAPLTCKTLVTISKLYDREELVDLLQAVSPPPRLLQQYSTIGFVGYPNVGKSSTINCLMKEKKVTVSATPGKTKHFQTLHLNSRLVLCDCPGLVFPGFVSTKQEMIIWGILPIDRATDYRSPVTLICHTLQPETLEAAYSIPLPAGTDRSPTAEELLSAYSVTRSFMSSRGRPDESRAARAILKDFVNGRLLHCIAPPLLDQTCYHTYTVQPKCKNRVKLTPQQQIHMPDTNAEVLNTLDAAIGIVKENSGKVSGSKRRKERVYKPKGLVEYIEEDDGSIVEVIKKPWLNKGPRTVRGKKNPNTNNPYEKQLW